MILVFSSSWGLRYNLLDRMPDDLELTALRNACQLEQWAAGTRFHSDRGSQYARDDFRDAVDALKKMVPNISRNGNC